MLAIFNQRHSRIVGKYLPLMAGALVAMAVAGPAAYAEEAASMTAKAALSRALGELKERDPRNRLFDAGMYSLTEGNSLPGDWLIDTPHVWGRSARDLPVANGCRENCNEQFNLQRCQGECGGGLRCIAFPATVDTTGIAPQSLCVGHSDDLVNQFYTAIANAQSSVDLLTLQGLPTGRFLQALKNAVSYLAATHRSVTIRLLFGQYPSVSLLDTKGFLGNLVDQAKKVKDSHLKIYAAAENTDHFTSWNHAKVLAVDGKTVIEGGHNLHDEIYLRERPVFDLSMKLNGPAAITAHRFANRLWSFVCKHNDHGSGKLTYSNSWESGKREVGERCLARIGLPDDAAGGGIPVLAVASPGWGLVENTRVDPSEVAMLNLFNHAQEAIQISQMDLGFKLKVGNHAWPKAVLEAIGKFIIQRKKDVYIVLSAPGARSADGKVEFSWDAPLQSSAKEIFAAALKVHGAPPKRELANLLCSKLHIAPFLFGPDSKWPNGTPIGNHAKAYIVDHNVFYIGSYNMYPLRIGEVEGRLQELGYVVGDAGATRSFEASYFNPLWEYSKKDAVIGNSGRCILDGN